MLFQAHTGANLYYLMLTVCGNKLIIGIAKMVNGHWYIVIVNQMWLKYNQLVTLHHT